jgi:hypothetical protein
MNKRLFWITCFILCLKMTAVAQDREMKYAQLTGIEYTDPGLTNKGIYLNEDFVPGSVVLNSGDVVSGLYSSDAYDVAAISNGPPNDSSRIADIIGLNCFHTTSCMPGMPMRKWCIMTWAW